MGRDDTTSAASIMADELRTIVDTVRAAGVDADDMKPCAAVRDLVTDRDRLTAVIAETRAALERVCEERDGWHDAEAKAREEANYYRAQVLEHRLCPVDHRAPHISHDCAEAIEDQRDRLTAENAALREALRECAEEAGDIGVIESQMAEIEDALSSRQGTKTCRDALVFLREDIPCLVETIGENVSAVVDAALAAPPPSHLETLRSRIRAEALEEGLSACAAVLVKRGIARDQECGRAFLDDDITRSLAVTPDPEEQR